MYRPGKESARMYHVECIDIHKDDPLFAYADRASLCANNMYNVANFYIRNLMTGLRKDIKERTENESTVIDIVNGSVSGINSRLREKYERKIRKIRETEGISEEERADRIAKVKYLEFCAPTAEKWFASYGLLDAVLKFKDDPDYRAFHAHVIQNAIKACCLSWKGYFESLKAFSSSSGHTGRPKIPGYRKPGGRSTAVLSNIACSIKHGRLFFPYYTEDSASADGQKQTRKQKRVRHSICIAGLPHAAGDKLIEVRVVPYFGIYQVQIVTDDGRREEELLPDERDIIAVDGTPAGVMMLDSGLNNFAAIADNKGNEPIVIKGGAVKAENQWFNKRMAFLKSEQMKGHDPETYHPPVTRQMNRIRRKRDAFLRDTFYKYAHYICRLMEERGLSYLIIGYNSGQKQGIDLGKRNNQSFVQVPYARFRRILQTVCLRYGIRVILQEESYTSKACFGSRDRIPTYGKDDTEGIAFSGKRTKRGLYLQDDGKVMNADINGAVNTGRKHEERIFPEGRDYGYLYGPVKAMTYKDILRASRNRNKSNPGKTGQRACVCPVTA